MTRTELEQYAKEVFSDKVFSELQEWYDSVIHCGCDFVVFIVRRCYILFLLMQEINGIGMEKEAPHTIFLTDSSVLLHAKEMAEYLKRRERLPRMMFVDDVFIHGRNVNRMLHTLEKHLLFEIENDNDFGNDIDIRSELTHAVQLSVFVSYEENRLLDYRYREKLVPFMRTDKQKVWRRISNQISKFVVHSDITNACFVYTSLVDVDNVLKGLEQDFPRTVFQGCIQHTKIEPVLDESGVLAYATVRMIQTPKSKKMRIAPFVFLPDLSTNEVDNLSREILQEFRNEEINQWMNLLKHISGRRAYHEMIVLMLSTMYLFEIKAKYFLPLFTSTEVEKETAKLARNYDTYGVDVVRSLKTIISLCEGHYSSLRKVLSSAIQGRNNWLKSDGAFEYSNVQNLYDFWGFNEEILIKVNEDFRSYVKNAGEIYFYNKGREEELSAYQKKDTLFIYEKNEPRGESVSRAISHISYMLSVKGIGGDDTEKYIIRYLLQMMDAGVLGVFINVLEDEEDNQGLSQYAKAGEPSQQMLTMKMYRFLFFLEAVYKRAYFKIRTVKEELHLYFNSKECKFTESEKMKIIHYQEHLERTEEKPDDWKIDFLEQIDTQAKDKSDNMPESQPDLQEKIRLLVDSNDIRRYYVMNAPK